jgi:hypothetical protein
VNGLASLNIYFARQRSIMENNKINKNCNLVLIGFFLLITIRVFIFFIEDENPINRKIQSIIGYFITLPTVLISLTFTIIILNYYFSNRNEMKINCILKIIPFIIFFLWHFVLLSFALFN